MAEAVKLVFLLVAVSCFTFVVCGTAKDRVSLTSSKDWDVLVFTQFWPPAACILFEDEARKCNITADMKSWKVHGLWPTKNGTEDPNFCNSTWKFDVHKIQILQPRLGQDWPTVMEHEKPEELWEHEWVKHGTCASSLPILKGELNYFNVTLGLHDHFNLLEFIKDGGIIPSDTKTYKGSDVEKILYQKIGSSPALTCVKSKTNGKCYLEQIEICLTKSFKPANCAPTTSFHIARHDLRFQSEKSISRIEESFCDCRSEELYYKPFPSK